MKNVVCPNRSDGFTLIELLVVISIIALLIGILLPSLGNARWNAQNLSCLTQPRQIAVAEVGYSIDHKDKLVVPETLDEDGVAFGGPRGISVDEALSHYLSSPVPRGEAIARQWTSQSGHEVWQCPLENLPRANPTSTAGRRSYSMNFGFTKEFRENAGPWRDNWTGPRMDVNNWAPGDQRNGNQGRLTDVKPQSVLLGDAVQYWDHIGYVGGNGFSVTIAMAQSAGYTRGFGEPGWPFGPSQFYAHERKVGADPTPNMAFADGSARTIDIVGLMKEWGHGSGPYPGPISTRGTIFDAWY